MPRGRSDWLDGVVAAMLALTWWATVVTLVTTVGGSRELAVTVSAGVGPVGGVLIGLWVGSR